MDAMMVEQEFDLNKLRNLYQFDRGRVELAKERQAKVWRGEKPDKWPIIVGGELKPEQKEIPDANYKEAFYDSGKMLCSQMKGAMSMANSGSDTVPSIRANMGCGTLASLLGLNQEVFEDKMPWLHEHMNKEQISKLEPDDIKIQGDFAKGAEHMKFFKEVMGNDINIYCMDTQGPFDVAHLLMGDDMFMEMYDDPPFVHHLMNIAVELGIKGHTWCKEISGEPLDQIYHGCSLYAENMGVRICEDTSVLIGPKDLEQFVVPYTQKLAKHFGGAWIHYCGPCDILTDAVCGIPEIRGINYGFVPGKNYDHRFKEDMERCRKSGKVYYGSWPRFPGESGQDYLKRLYEWASEGCLIPHGHPAIGDNGFKSGQEVLDFWYNL